jgi:hypothetical protein
MNDKEAFSPGMQRVAGMSTATPPRPFTPTPGARMTAREYARLPKEDGRHTALYRGVVVKILLIKDLHHDWIAGICMPRSMPV